MKKLLALAVLCLLFNSLTVAKKFKEGEKPSWAKKDIRDFNDADMERLLEQWEEDDDPLEPDELPEHLRPPPSIDMGSVDASNPENILKLSKKGRTLMSFVSVNGNPTREETEDITKLWQTSLWNNHIQAERYLIDDNRAIFMFKDGAQAWEAKDFLVEQDRCLHVSIENKEYKGKHNRDEL
ncbi:AGAP005081-PA [Anopheles gambiae str. PEST]|uniref:AGAP005081-PA n=1 Tax=Anopheles gambiae TaxID=7165 RepID=Q7Q9R4_ANOGA|nr:LDLR chaperone boca [Anopheles coluzzii]XP_313960.3 LDLR chaperone boca [Anopheles gambiae]EAA09378.3 AGAP005081-PA [Anopheles gambiae str. PEST]